MATQRFFNGHAETWGRWFLIVWFNHQQVEFPNVWGRFPYFFCVFWKHVCVFFEKKASHACIQKMIKLFGFVDKPYTPEVEHSPWRMMVERRLFLLGWYFFKGYVTLSGSICWASQMSEDGKELRFYCSVYQYTSSSQYCIDWEIGSSRYFKDLW